MSSRQKKRTAKRQPADEPNAKSARYAVDDEAGPSDGVTLVYVGEEEEDLVSLEPEPEPTEPIIILEVGEGAVEEADDDVDYEDRLAVPDDPDFTELDTFDTDSDLFEPQTVLVAAGGELRRCSNNCGGQFLFEEALLKHERRCLRETGSAFPPLAGRIVAYFELVTAGDAARGVRRKHRWLWQFLKELLADASDTSCGWVDRVGGRFQIADLVLCRFKWDNYRRLKKLPAPAAAGGEGHGDFDGCFRWYLDVGVVKRLSADGETPSVYQFHPYFYREFFENYRYLTSIRREGGGGLPPLQDKPKAPPRYCGKNCGSQYKTAAALLKHEAVCSGSGPEGSRREQLEECDESRVVGGINGVDYAVVYPTNNKNVMVCSLCRKFWNTTGLRIHMRKAHNLSRVLVERSGLPKL